MNFSAPSFVSWLAEASLFGSGMIFFTWILIPWMRKFLGARAAFILWAFVLLRLLVPLPNSPLAYVSTRGREESTISNPLQSIPVTTITTTVSNVKERQISAAQGEPRDGKISWMLLAWGIGAGGTLGLALFQALRAGRIIHRAMEIQTHPVLQKALLNLGNIPSRLRICETSELQSPALCGLLKPTILLPTGWIARLSRESLQCILCHEIGHIRRGDLLWRWAFILARSVHWFNPLVWIAEHTARIDQEIACDEWVMAHRGAPEREAYGEALLEACQMFQRPGSTAPSHLAMAETKSGLTRRIRHLSRIRPRGKFALLAGLGIAIALLTVIAPARSDAPLQTENVQQVPKETPSESPASEEETIGQVEIESKFLEVSGEEAKRLFEQNIANSNGDGTPHLEGIFTNTQYQRVLRNLNQMKGMDLMSAPSVTTKSGRRATIHIIREFRYPSEFDFSSPGKATPTTFETKNTGVEVDVEPTILGGDQIAIQFSPKIIHFKGFVNYGGSRAARASSREDGMQGIADIKLSSQAINQPIFEVRSITTNLELKSGETALLGGFTYSDEQMERNEKTGEEFKRKINKQLYILITARIVKAEEARPHPSQDNSPKLSGGNLPYGTAVTGKPGFVTSPHSPHSGLIDVRGYNPGTEVKDPYSGKMFLVP